MISKLTISDWIIIAIVALLLVFAVRKCARQHNTKVIAGEVAAVQKIKDAPVVHYKDDSGTVHAQKPVAVADEDVLRQVYGKTIDSLKKLLQGKKKKVETYVAMGTQTRGTVHSDQAAPDQGSDCPDTLSFKDDWVKAKVVSDKDGYRFEYDIQDSLSVLFYSKKTGWFARQLYADVTSRNPKTTITGVTAIKIPSAKPKRFGIGVSVGYRFDGRSMVPYLGAGIQYNLIRF